MTKTTKKAQSKKPARKAMKNNHKTVEHPVPPANAKIHLVKKENPFRGAARKAQFARVKSGMTVEQYKVALAKAKLAFDNRVLDLAARKYNVIRLTA